MRYYPKTIESKWQRRWLKEKIYEPDLGRARRPFYNLMMFPYPSAEGLHIGSVRTFTGVDIYGRFKRMQGYDVFEPIGLDGFGIHSENYALKIGEHPMQHAKDSEKNFYRQLGVIGNGFAWRERLETYDPEYYKWTQWIFTQMFKRGLAYRKKAAVNWCPSCKTVLADEQVIQKSQIPNPKSQTNSKSQTLNSKHETKISVCERCDTSVVKKELEQWFFRITKYADRLLKNLEKIDWPEPIKIVQRNWIGKSEGSLIKFALSRTDADFTRTNADGLRRSASSQRESAFIEVFTTRPDTLFGATYMVLAPEHPLVENNKPQITNHEEVEEYIKKAKAKTEEERIAEVHEKTGVELKGIKAVNPATKEEIPIWVADYVLGHVGTGAIMAVPAHDERDWEFAKKFGLPIRPVVVSRAQSIAVGTPPGELDREIAEGQRQQVQDISVRGAFVGMGMLIDSGKFSGMSSEKAKWEITKFVDGEKKVQYRLRDWLISRQRYWGPPIPLIFCENCKKLAGNPKSEIPASPAGRRNPKFSQGELENPGWIAVPEKDLPVRLPYIKDFRPTGTERSPLALVEKFYKVRCPKCKSWARRETDVSDTFLDSAWYYIGYLAKENSKFEIRNSKFRSRAKRWLPVDMYIGGAEHAVLHLLYVRFLATAFHDWGLLRFEEPFKKFRTHGLITKDGAKMSKSRGNIVSPDEYIKAYGSDAVRMYLAFIAPLTQGGDFRDTGIKGITRFLERVFKLISNFQFPNSKQIPNPKLQRLVHRTIKKVTEDIENLQYNTAISALMILLNELEANPQTVSKDDIKVFLKLLAPFAPFITEELWYGLTTNDKRPMTSIHISAWPKYDPKLLQEDTFEMIVQVNGKVRGRVALPVGTNEAEAKRAALGLGAVKKYVTGIPKKVIFVEDKLINFVV